jgi:putative transposase
LGIFELALDKSKSFGYSLVDGSSVSQALAGLNGESSSAALSADVLSMYLRLLPAEFLAEIRRKEQIRENNRVYNAAVVMWLMITQRLHGNAPMEAAVLELLRGLPADFWPRPCKRLTDWEEDPKALASYTGAYNQARQQLSVSLVAACSDRIFNQLIEHTNGTLASVGRRAFFLDGSTLRTPHTESLRQRYPPGSNQYGESYWPLLRIVVAHDLHTGLAMRPEWGPENGDHSVSEQALLARAIDRLPSGAVVLGDANFGVFSVAYAAGQRKHPVLLRLTPVRAKHLLGEPMRDGIDRPIEWRPTREDRRSHPELPGDACVSGRVLVRQVQPDNGAEPFLLALFATMEETAGEAFDLYGMRWNIETDLRTLKSTLKLDDLTCQTPDMVAKEINLAMVAYNLVRAVTYLAAQKAGLAPRRYSFSKVRHVVNVFAPLIAAAKDEREAQKYFDRMMYYAGQGKLPNRTKKRRSYPRTKLRKPQSFPYRKT